MRKKRDRRRDSERERCSFSSICLYTHTILGTHFQAQTDGLMNVNTHTHRRLFFYFVTALVCPMLSLHAALKLEVLTPTCPGTGVQMLMLMAGIYSRQCSDPSPAMSGLDCGGQSEVKEGRGACSPITGDDEAEKRASSVLRRGGGGSCQHWRQSYLDRPKHAGSRGVGGLLPRVTCLGSRLYPLPCLLRCQG